MSFNFPFAPRSNSDTHRDPVTAQREQGSCGAGLSKARCSGNETARTSDGGRDAHCVGRRRRSGSIGEEPLDSPKSEKRDR